MPWNGKIKWKARSLGAPRIPDTPATGNVSKSKIALDFDSEGHHYTVVLASTGGERYLGRWTANPAGTSGSAEVRVEWQGDDICTLNGTWVEPGFPRFGGTFDWDAEVERNS